MRWQRWARLVRDGRGSGRRRTGARIDPRLEELVRAAIDAAVKRRFDKLDEALRSFPDDEAVGKGVELAMAVTSYVMIDAHSGMPTDEQIRSIAGDVAEMESWAQPSADQVHAFLSCLLAGQPLGDRFDAESAIILTFVVAGSLLASLHEPAEKWWDYLDRAETAIESI